MNKPEPGGGQATPNPPEKALLSEREHEILRLVATGVSNKEIAQQLHISTNTVKVHLRSIFAKINVASRTEATLHAIREGLIDVPRPMEGQPQSAKGYHQAESVKTQAEHLSTAAPSLATAQEGLTSRRLARYWPGLVVLLMAAIGFGAWRWVPAILSPTPPALATATPAILQWQPKAQMPTARSGLAVASYENKLYAIGGEAADGVTDRVERYDPALDTWTVLASKPVAVTDIGAAVIGGLIYVPGGRLASGVVTNTLEIYDPHEDRWTQRARLPVPLSAYALAAFEGKLYLFGGWNGATYLASVFEYDPTLDTWTEQTPMPTARGYAGAAVAGGKIYVLGGTDGVRALSANEVYTPEAEAREDDVWQSRAPMPEARYAMGVASVVDAVHIFGGKGKVEPLSLLEYLPQQDHWQSANNSITEQWYGMGMAFVEADFYVTGGLMDGIPTAQTVSHQAIYTVMFPIVK